MNKKILVLAFTGSFLVFANGTLLAVEEGKEPDIASFSGMKDAEGAKELALPSINEIYGSAQSAKVTGDWGGTVTLEDKSYGSMKPAERAFEVGKTLSDISFLVLSRDDAPSKGIQDVAFNALSSLDSLPSSLQSELGNLENSKGDLKGDALRKKMDGLVNLLLSAQGSKDEAVRDTGMTLLAGSYFKAYYLTAKTVKDYSDPTAAQLELFSWGDLTNNFIDYFINIASDNYKNDENIKVFLTGLKKIKPIVDKPRDKITKDDVVAIYNALNRSFK